MFPPSFLSIAFLAAPAPPPLSERIWAYLWPMIGLALLFKFYAPLRSDLKKSLIALLRYPLTLSLCGGFLLLTSSRNDVQTSLFEPGTPLIDLATRPEVRFLTIPLTILFLCGFGGSLAFLRQACRLTFPREGSLLWVLLYGMGLFFLGTVGFLLWKNASVYALPLSLRHLLDIWIAVISASGTFLLFAIVQNPKSSESLWDRLAARFIPFLLVSASLLALIPRFHSEVLLAIKLLTPFVMVAAALFYENSLLNGFKRLLRAVITHPLDYALFIAGLFCIFKILQFAPLFWTTPSFFVSLFLITFWGALNARIAEATP